VSWGFSERGQSLSHASDLGASVRAAEGCSNGIAARGHPSGEEGEQAERERGTLFPSST